MAMPSAISSFERIIGPLEISTGPTLQYTAQGLRRISDIYLTTGTTARTVDLYVVPVGDTAASGNKFLDTFATIANDVRMVTGLNYAIRPGETIWTACSGAGVKLVIIAYR